MLRKLNCENAVSSVRLRCIQDTFALPVFRCLPEKGIVEAAGRLVGLVLDGAYLWTCLGAQTWLNMLLAEHAIIVASTAELNEQADTLPTVPTVRKAYGK